MKPTKLQRTVRPYFVCPPESRVSARAPVSHGLGEEVDPDRCLVVLVEVVVHESRDDARLPHALVPQEHELVLGEGGDLRDSGGCGSILSVGKGARPCVRERDDGESGGSEEGVFYLFFSQTFFVMEE